MTPGILDQAATLASKLYQELIEQNLWDGMKTFGEFSKAKDYILAEERIFQLEQENHALKIVKNQRDWIIKRSRKLDAIHECKCELCQKQRNKFDWFVNETDY